MTTLVALQATALLVLLVRLSKGRRRLPPARPHPDDLRDTTVTAVIPALNEAERIRPCLHGLAGQGAPLLEILVVVSPSNDGTEDVIREAAAVDPRVRLLHDPPLPPGWIGKVWALQHALESARGEWVLGIDADVEPVAGMVAGVVQSARSHDLDLASFGPRFAAQSPGERWLHPSLLLTLVYRFGAPTVAARPERALANGQCFLIRREILLKHGGYAAARNSFADDVTLARHYARLGARVGFVDGSRLLSVRAYRSLAEMWREWGRSIDLSDATRPVVQWLDIALLILVQGIPLFSLAAAASGLLPLEWAVARVFVGLNALLLTIRLLMLVAIAPAYERRGAPFWLSPLTDPAAVARIVLSSLRRPRQWRGRRYDSMPPVGPVPRAGPASGQGVTSDAPSP